MQSLQLINAQNCSESSLVDTHTTKSIDVKDQQSVSKRIKVGRETKICFFFIFDVVEFYDSVTFILRLSCLKHLVFLTSKT